MSDGMSEFRAEVDEVYRRMGDVQLVADFESLAAGVRGRSSHDRMIVRFMACRDEIFGRMRSTDVTPDDVVHPVVHHADVDYVGSRRYPWRPSCTCGWQGRGYAAQHAARTVADGHMSDPD